jgi:hypothetical protein
MKRGRGQPKHAPTDDQRKIVTMAAMIGTPHHDIAPLIGISIKTLLRHYRKELDISKTSATVKVGGTLYNAAVSGNVTAMIFWMKAQAGWRDVHIVKHGGDEQGVPIAHAIATSEITDEDAMKAYLQLIAKSEPEDSDK